MGCGSSRAASSEGDHPVRVAIGAPQNVQIHIPRNRADAHGVPRQQVTLDIDSKTLYAALQYVSEYIAHRKQHVSVIAVGGAVNTLYLKSRATTHDVDIFGSDFGNQARILLDSAMEAARQHFPALGTDWLNTETQMWMPGHLHEELTLEARQQNVKIFNGAGLRIYAAPWQYAFTAKLSRILTGGGQVREYDLADAVTYLHEFIRSHQNRPVPLNRILQWASHYNHHVNNSILQQRVNIEYRRRYRTNGIA